MNRKEMIKFLAKISWRNGKNTSEGRDTLTKWEEFYDTFSTAELQEDVQSYGC